MQKRALMKWGLEKWTWDTEVPQTDVLLQTRLPIKGLREQKEDPRSLERGWEDGGGEGVL